MVLFCPNFCACNIGCCPIIHMNSGKDVICCCCLQTCMPHQVFVPLIPGHRFHLTDFFHAMLQKKFQLASIPKSSLWQHKFLKFLYYPPHPSNEVFNFLFSKYSHGIPDKHVKFLLTGMLFFLKRGKSMRYISKSSGEGVTDTNYNGTSLKMLQSYFLPCDWALTTGTKVVFWLLPSQRIYTQKIKGHSMCSYQGLWMSENSIYCTASFLSCSSYMCICSSNAADTSWICVFPVLSNKM